MDLQSRAWDPSGDTALATSPAMTHGAVLQLLRRNGPITRRDLARLTAMSRTTLFERLEGLQRLHLVREGRRSPTDNGRPPVMVEFDDRSRVVLAVDIGASHSTLAITDLSARRIALAEHRLDLDDEPATVAALVVDHAKRLLDACEWPTQELLGIGLTFPGLPGRAPGTIEAAAVLQHWDGVAIGPMISEAFGAPVILCNDAHAMAYGEYLADGKGRSLLAVKIATGIGAGIVIDGRLHYGDSRGAGQFGHMRVPGLTERCDCGERGCLATVASGRALVRRLKRQGVRAVDDILRGVDEANADVLLALEEAGSAVGVVLSGVVTMLDPGVVLLGGPLGHLDPFFEAARTNIKKLAYQRTGQHVTISKTRLGEGSAVTGVAALLVDTALQPSVVDRMVAEQDNP